MTADAALREGDAFPERKLYAAAVMLGGIGFGVMQDALLKQLSGGYPFHQMQMMRSLVGAGFIGAWLFWTYGAGALKGSFSWLVVLRGTLLGLGSAFFYLGLAAMSMADAVAIYFAMPMVIVVLSAVWLGERVQIQRWIAAGLGFVGVAVTIGPSSALFNWASILPLIATVFYAFGNLLTRRLGPDLHPMITAFYAGVCFVLVAGVLSLIFGFGTFETNAHPSLAFLTKGWVMPTLLDGLTIFLVGVMTVVGFLTYVVAYRLAQPSFVAPFEYSAMIWAVVLGFAFFGDVPTSQTLWGSAIIIAAGLFLGWQEHRTGRN